MKRAEAAYKAVQAARDILEALYSVDVWTFDDKRIRDIAYGLNDMCIALSKIRDEEERNDEKDA